MNIANILEIILGVIAFFAISFLGLAVYLRNTKSHTNRLFLVLALILDTYVVTNYLSLHPPLGTPENQLFWIRIVMFQGSFIGPALFLLIHTFPKDKIYLPFKYLLSLFILMASSAAASILPLVFKSIEYVNGRPIPQPGLGMPIFFLDFGGLFILSFIVSIVKYYKAPKEEKVKHRLLFFGILFSFSLMAIGTTIFVAIFKNSGLVFLGPIFPVILMGFISYAIIKHRFLDIQPLIARAVSFIFLIFLISLFFVSAAFLGSAFILKTRLDIPTILIGIALTTAISLTFQPIQAAIRKVTDRIFFKDLYDSEKLLSELSHAMAETINFDDLTDKILNTIIKEMKIAKAAFLTIDGHRIKEVRGMGYGEKELLKSPLEEQIHHELKSEMHSFIFQELEDEKMKEVFRKYEVEVLIPIKVKKNEIAILILGPKASGNMYSAQDLRLLDVFSSEAGIAIQNAKLYTDLKITSEAKSKFVSVVSHQLRTPISVIRWSLEMMREKDLTPKDKETFLDDSYQGAIFLGEQLDDILIALDIYDQKLFIKKEPCNLYDIFKDLTPEFATIVKTKKLNIQYDIAHEANIVKADERKLSKMIKILLKNAITYSSSGGTIKITAKIENQDNKNRIIISISDSGIGITDAERSHVFEEFFRSDTARTVLPNGLGLGMFIVQAFAMAHGGEIWFYSEGRGKGADFHIALPLE